MKIIKSLFLALLCVALAVPAHAREELSIAGLQVVYYAPVASLPAGTPVILLSHGIGGCNDRYGAITEALAQSGYAVFGLNHADSACLPQNAGKAQLPPIPFEKGEQWSDATFKNRAEETKHLLDALSTDGRFAQYDWQHVGYMGHSLGGYTALGMAGGWPSWKDGRIKAVLALSPYLAPYIAHATLGGIDVPVMYQGGTRDWLTPPLQGKDGAYAQTTSPKFYVEFDGADHNSWGGNNAYSAQMAAYSVAFFDYALRGIPLPEKLTTATLPANHFYSSRP